MAETFFERPILNSPYEYPSQHWKLDADGQPTDVVQDKRRRSDLITPVPKPKRRRGAQLDMVLDSGDGLSTAEQDTTPPRSSTRSAATSMIGGFCPTQISGG